MNHIVFWQDIVSPHMYPLAKALSTAGFTITYVVEQAMSSKRALMGWIVDERENGKIELKYLDRPVAIVMAEISPNAVHIVQGIHGNGVIGSVRRELKKRKARWGIIMEAVDERHVYWFLKRALYRWRFTKMSYCPDFVLAIGAGTPDWVIARGYSADLTFPYTYFIGDKYELLP